MTILLHVNSDTHGCLQNVAEGLVLNKPVATLGLTAQAGTFWVAHCMHVLSNLKTQYDMPICLLTHLRPHNRPFYGCRTLQILLLLYAAIFL